MASKEIRSELLKYGKSTSVRGVPKFFNSKDKFLKILWALCVVICSAVLIYFLVISFVKYYSWPVMTKTGEMVGEDFTFPDITVCNLDVFSAGYPKDLPINSYFRFLNMNKDRFYKIIHDEYNQSYTEARSIYYEFYSVPGYILNLPKNAVQEELDCPRFIADCTIFTIDWIENGDCTKNFTRYWNENYYTCHTIRTSEMNSALNLTTRGITLVLNVGSPNQHQMPYQMTLAGSQARGVQVSVHSPGTPPDLKRGFSVAPGTENIVTIVQTERKRLEKPHNVLGCTKQEKQTSYPNEKYTHDNCIDYCKQLKVWNSCKCMSHYLSVPDNVEMENDVKMCSNFSFSNGNSISNDSEAYDIIQQALHEYHCSVDIIEETDCESGCLMPCEETEYDTYLTTSSWPQSSLQLSVFEKFIFNCTDAYPGVKQRYAKYFQLYNEYDDFSDSNMGSAKEYNVSISELTQIQESLLVVKLVIMDNFPYYATDQEAYTWDTMIGVVGGMLSLWLGITVATGVELIELLYLLVRCCFRKRKSVVTNVDIRPELNGNQTDMKNAVKDTTNI